ncbi:hypothetical protein LTR85_002709 [Meristemomyces frigidus]|nr:hypothetical protein LTR85_002709 [Meristemomyces frigidus]
MAGDNPTLASAEQDTGIAPLNAGPSAPQPPQHDPIVSDPTIDDIPSALQSPPAPFQPFTLALDAASGTHSRNKRSVPESSGYPSDSDFEDLVKATLRPEGPARAESIKAEDVRWPEGSKGDIVKRVKSAGSEGDVKVYKLVQGKRKADIFVVSLDVDSDTLVGVRFPEQAG